MAESGRLSRELGRRMLQGWAMLAHNCPADACAVPLLRSPDRTHTLCVSCGTHTPLGPAAAGGPSSATAPPAAPLAPQGAAAGPQSPLENGHALQGEDLNSDDSLALSVEVLGGAGSPGAHWERGAPGEGDEGLGTGRGEGGGELEQRRVDLQSGSQRSWDEQQEEQQGQQGQQQPIGSWADAGSRQGRAVNPVSSRLLEGWAMLDAFCPHCLNPIMRSRAGESRCVVCPVPQGTAVAQAHPQRNPRPQPEPMPQTQPMSGQGEQRGEVEVITSNTGAGAGEEAAEGAVQGVKGVEGMEGGEEPAEGRGAALGFSTDAPRAVCAVEPLQPPLPSREGQGYQLEAEAVIRVTHAALVAKLHELTQHLETERELLRVTHVLKAISECSVALKNIRSLTS